MLSLRRMLFAVCMPLLAVAAAAQVLEVRPVAVAGGTQLLVTSLDPSGLSTTTVLVPPGGAAASHAGPSLGGETGAIEDGPQRYYTRWSDVWGSQHTVMTQKLPQESYAQHAERHELALDLVLLQFPAAQGTADWPMVGFTPPEGTDYFFASWHGTDGLDHSVTTVKKAGESVDKWVKRHADAVDALLARFPKAPG